MSRPALILACAVVLAPTLARAQSAPCWYEQGVVVVAASVAGIAGDYILDTGAPATLIHETRAQAAGFEGEAVTGEVRVAGVSLRDRPVGVADLDARTWAFETPIAGVIGVDTLGGYVVDVRFSPCRVSLHPSGKAGRFRALAALPMADAAVVPVVPAAVADGATTRQGGFVASTGADAPLRLSDRVARVGRVGAAAEPEAVYPYGGALAALRALSLAEELDQFVPSGLVKADALPPDAIGEIGPPILSRYVLRFDFPGRRLLFGAP